MHPFNSIHDVTISYKLLKDIPTLTSYTPLDVETLNFENEMDTIYISKGS